MVIFDPSIFDLYKVKAIQKVEDLKIGETYYSVLDPEEFVLMELVTTKEMYRRLRINAYVFDNKPNKLRWMRVKLINGTSERDADEYVSLEDRNIGSSYNPWLIFDNKEVAEEYRANIMPTLLYGKRGK